MKDHNVVILASQEELITSLYHDYLVSNNISTYTLNDVKLSVKSFSDYILQYLIDRYNLDKEETDA